MSSADNPEQDASTAPDGPVDVNDDKSLRAWCDHFGTTEQQLQEAVAAVGGEPSAVREHLLNQGASAGAG